MAQLETFTPRLRSAKVVPARETSLALTQDGQDMTLKALPTTGGLVPLDVGISRNGETGSLNVTRTWHALTDIVHAADRWSDVAESLTYGADVRGVRDAWRLSLIERAADLLDVDIEHVRTVDDADTERVLNAAQMLAQCFDAESLDDVDVDALLIEHGIERADVADRLAAIRSDVDALPDYSTERVPTAPAPRDVAKRDPRRVKRVIGSRDTTGMAHAVSARIPWDTLDATLDALPVLDAEWSAYDVQTFEHAVGLTSTLWHDGLSLIGTEAHSWSETLTRSGRDDIGPATTVRVTRLPREGDAPRSRPFPADHPVTLTRSIGLVTYVATVGQTRVDPGMSRPGERSFATRVAWSYSHDGTRWVRIEHAPTSSASKARARRHAASKGQSKVTRYSIETTEVRTLTGKTASDRYVAAWRTGQAHAWSDKGHRVTLKPGEAHWCTLTVQSLTDKSKRATRKVSVGTVARHVARLTATR